MKYYSLYQNKDKFKLEIKLIKESNHMFKTFDKEYGDSDDFTIHHFNINYYVCKDRKTLRLFAQQLKDEWIADAEKFVKDLKNIKIQMK